MRYLTRCGECGYTRNTSSAPGQCPKCRSNDQLPIGLIDFFEDDNALIRRADNAASHRQEKSHHGHDSDLQGRA
jgi:hypothetical protein